MLEKLENLYPEDKAQDEANLMREKIEKGEAKNENEAEKIIEDEKGDNWEKKYEERKKLIKKTDEELIKSVMSHEGHAYQDQTEHTLLRGIAKNQIFLKKFMSEKSLYDLGCGEGGHINALKLFGKEETTTEYDLLAPKFFLEDGEEDKYINVGIEKVVLVDPYVEKKWINASLKRKKESYEIDDNLLENIKFEKKDGLSFLNKAKTESGNVITASVNYSLINNSEYLKRVAQEIYRVTPKDGVYISRDSDSIEEEARKLFSKEIKDGQTCFFFKKEIDNFEERQDQIRKLAELKEKNKIKYTRVYSDNEQFHINTLNLPMER